MRPTIVLAAALFLGAPAPTDVARLDSDHQPFVRDFRESKGRARLVAILFPT